MRLGTMWGSFLRHERLGEVSMGLDMVRRARQYGFDSYLFHVGRELPSVDDKGLLSETRNVLKDLGMTCTLADRMTRAAAEGDTDSIRRTFDAANALDAHCVNSIWSPGMNRRWEDGWDQATADEYVQRDIETTAMLGEYAQEYDMPIAFENHLDYVFGEIARIMDAVDNPYVGLNFDTGNPLVFLQDPVRFARRFADRIFSLHLKDAYTLPHDHGARVVWCSLGRGLVDIPRILEILSRQDRELVLNLEFWAQAAHDVPFNADSYWRHLLEPRGECGHVLQRVKEDLKVDRPELGTRDEEGLRDEVRAMRDAPRYVRGLLSQLALAPV